MKKIKIHTAKYEDLRIIHRLAHKIWWPTYGELLPHGQIRLMLDNIYSESSLRAQRESGQQFAIATRRDVAVGFVGYQPKQELPAMRIEKLYVLPSEQGKGTGKRLIDHVVLCALDAGFSLLELNVYRHNPAKAFYEHMGFSVTAEVAIPYHGYTLRDYIMQKPL